MALEFTLLAKDPLADGEAAVASYPLGQDIILTARFRNVSAQALRTPDPRASQHLILTFVSRSPHEQTDVLINPGTMDILGEFTAPRVPVIDLAAGEVVERDLSLPGVVGDRCLDVGLFEVGLRFRDALSEPLLVRVAYRPESVPLLIALFLNERAGRWSRNQALRFLRQLPEAPDLMSTTAGDTAESVQERIARNERQAERYLATWPERAQSPATQAFFQRLASA